jgi:hypothetical protein
LNMARPTVQVRDPLPSSRLPLPYFSSPFKLSPTPH